MIDGCPSRRNRVPLAGPRLSMVIGVPEKESSCVGGSSWSNVAVDIVSVDTEDPASHGTLVQTRIAGRMSVVFRFYILLGRPSQSLIDTPIVNDVAIRACLAGACLPRANPRTVIGNNDHRLPIMRSTWAAGLHLGIPGMIHISPVRARHSVFSFWILPAADVVAVPGMYRLFLLHEPIPHFLY